MSALLSPRDVNPVVARGAGPSDPTPTFWLTRDRVGGDLQATVDIWTVRPERLALSDGDAIWLAPSLTDGAIATCADSWSVADARLRVRGAVPETDRECVRVGGGR